MSIEVYNTQGVRIFAPGANNYAEYARGTITSNTTFPIIPEELVNKALLFICPEVYSTGNPGYYSSVYGLGRVAGVPSGSLVVLPTSYWAGSSVLRHPMRPVKYVVYLPQEYCTPVADNFGIQCYDASNKLYLHSGFRYLHIDSAVPYPKTSTLEQETSNNFVIPQPEGTVNHELYVCVNNLNQFKGNGYWHDDYGYIEEVKVLGARKINATTYNVSMTPFDRMLQYGSSLRKEVTADFRNNPPTLLFTWA